MLKNLLGNIGLVSSSLLFAQSTIILSEQSVKTEYWSPSFEAPTQKQMIEKAHFVNDYLTKKEENDMLHSSKEYEKGWNRVERGGVMKIWLTKEYLGNVATILGATAAATAVILAVAILAVTMEVSKDLAFINPILGLIMAIIGVEFAIAVAVIMNKINSYDVGGYFTADYSIIGTPITAMATLRSQNEYESAPRLKPLNKKIKFGNNDSFNLIKDDKSQGKLESYWEIENSQKYFGVVDISEYTKYARGFKVDGITTNIALYDDDDEYSIQKDQSVNQFLHKYFQDKQNHYLFFVLEELENNTYKLEIGGSKTKKLTEEQHDWISRKIFNIKKVTDLSVQLLINLKS